MVGEYVKHDRTTTWKSDRSNTFLKYLPSFVRISPEKQGTIDAKEIDIPKQGYGKLRRY